MIKSFAHKGLEQFFKEGTKKGIQPRHANKLTLILFALNNATRANNMDIPGWVFHPLKGAKNIYAVRVDGNYRVTFRFEDGHAHVVDYLDYH
ncbi:MAG: type II toxin-antitoxin system RelE/ParE family toxin [Acidobacteria bacterium]|nr:type II toxin-antitoxin system RelE/ParE family toxin [Acidobacteriota bacterium]